MRSPKLTKLISSLSTLELALILELFLSSEMAAGQRAGAGSKEPSRSLGNGEWWKWLSDLLKSLKCEVGENIPHLLLHVSPWNST